MEDKEDTTQDGKPKNVKRSQWNSFFKRSPISANGMSLTSVALCIKESEHVVNLDKRKIDYMSKKKENDVVIYVVGSTLL